MDAAVGEARYRAADSVCDPDVKRAPFLAVLQRHQRVGRLPGLTENRDKMKNHG